MSVNKSVILEGDCLESLRAMDADSIDAIVTDPPYGLSQCKPDHITAALTAWLAGEEYKPKGKGFMGKSWDAFVPGPEVWRECMRVLKPGGHMAVFAGSRTVDLMGVSVRLAGFEIRDQLQWIYGSGFPKSMNVSKAIDKAAGALENESTGFTVAGYGHNDKLQTTAPSAGYTPPPPTTPAAKQWDGWGTALKPAHEPIILARKPLPKPKKYTGCPHCFQEIYPDEMREMDPGGVFHCQFCGLAYDELSEHKRGTVAANVLEHGTGGINVDGCRVAAAPDDLAKLQASTAAVIAKGGTRGESWKNTSDLSGANPVPDSGRWPANVILDTEAGAVLDGQSGISKSTKACNVKRHGISGGIMGQKGKLREARTEGHSDSGGASRFFYCPKTSKREREAGLSGATKQQDDTREPDAPGANNPRNRGGPERLNHHPTVKPLSLMAWICKLITPPNGTVLDPFTGSGSTGCAAAQEGFNFIGCELDPEYVKIARARIAHWSEEGDS